MPIILSVLSICVSYIFGSIPMGVLAGRLVTGVEVRQVGSGRTGATNVYRAAGPWGLALTSLGDILKGIFAIWVARIAMSYAVATGADPMLPAWIEALSGIAVVAGHNWSVFLGFRGGAGTVTTIGVIAAMNLYAAIVLIVIGLAGMLISRMASIGSIAIALLMGPVLVIMAATGVSPWAYVVFGVIAGAFTIYALIPNIKRILAGRERRFNTNN
jgi:glycerol-3-phosphate acyltransferase PlsY